MSFYIQPTTIIRLCEGVPLTPSYQNTLWFDELASQTTYFAGKVVMTFLQQSYQRKSRNRLRVKVNAESIEKVNYLIFDNNRWVDNTKVSKMYYAFVLDVIYINENTSEIVYQIDVMQTWFFDYHINACYVVREHVSDDTIGLHTEPEILELGPYQYESVGNLLPGDLNDPYIVFATTINLDTTDYSGGLRGGVFSGLNYIAFPATEQGASQAISFIESVPDKINGIIYCFMAPKLLAVAANTTSYVTSVNTRQPNTSWTFTDPDSPALAPNYPRNNKLYCYPYNFFGVSNNEGEMASYAWERWTKNQSGYVAESIIGVLSATTEMEYVPTGYNGVSGQNFNERIVSGNWPQCSWNNDPYKAWLATQGQLAVMSDIQSGFNTIVNIGNAAMSGAEAYTPATNVSATPSNPIYTNEGAMTSGTMQTSGATLNVGVAATAAINLVNQIWDLVEIAKKYEVYDLVPPTNHGSSAGVIDVATNIKGFIGYNIRIRDEYVMKIDDYFTRFGYACDRTKIPNRAVRQRWTYTRTRGCSITLGSVPQIDAVMIENIYDHGITFWRDTANVGNYYLSNPPLYN